MYQNDQNKTKVSGLSLWVELRLSKISTWHQLFPLLITEGSS